jgi:hypothetical protein
MNKIIIIRPDNSVEEQNLTDLEFVAKLSNAVAQHDITNSLTLWTYTKDENAGINAIASRIYDDYRGMNEDFFYGEVVFTGKSTLNRVYPISDEDSVLFSSYLSGGSNNA